MQDCFIPSGISVVTDADNNNSIFLESPESSSNLMISEEEEEKVDNARSSICLRT